MKVHDIPGLSCILPAPRPEAEISLRRFGSFIGGNDIRIQDQHAGCAS